MYLFLKKSYLNRVSFDQSALVKRTVFFLFSVCKGNSTLRSRQGLRKFGAEKTAQLHCAVFSARTLDGSPCSVVGMAGKKEKSVWLCSVLSLCVFPCGVYIQQEVSLSDILAFLALLKRILRLPLRHGSKSNGEDNIPLHGT